MSRRPSVPSASSFASPVRSAYVDVDSIQNTPATSTSTYSAAYSRTPSGSKQSNDNLNLDPDELFTKYTVAEVKSVQQRLRTDADAKQEELRLMVGERYRDLLQASTSIISLARSSQRVLQAFQESKEAILTQEEPPLPRQSSAVSRADDKHLHTLQVLSAHMKLLLDAPEHLWRLIERKRYFQAAWLFLLAGVVHRALAQDDDQDEETWSSQGVDVSSEFPLVQRQWDVVSQFRSQIIHKATLSLRESDSSLEDTCATLVTLHLLDSRPLSDTFTSLLSQRTKTLQNVLAWEASQKPAKSKSLHHANGHAQGESQRSLHRIPVREVKQATRKALAAISQTVCTARDIFEEGNSAQSLIGRVLESIQADSSEAPDYSKTLPPELYLTTQTLLMTHTSSAHFHLLTPNLKSYKPYVDLASSSSVLSQSLFTRTLQEWFEQSASSFQTSVESWFSNLENVKDVWSVRASMRQWIRTSRLQDQEKRRLLAISNELCQKRIVAIWQSALSNAQLAFKKELEQSLSALCQGSSERKIESSSMDLLFQPPPVPMISSASSGIVDIPFQKYQAALKRQLLGRTSLLDSVLTTLEQCARTIQQDLSHAVVDDNDTTRSLVDKMVSAYQPAGNALAESVIQTMETAFSKGNFDTQFMFDGLTFLARVADELASNSPFILDIGCKEAVVQNFRTKATAIHDRIIDRWRDHIVSRVISENLLHGATSSPLSSAARLSLTGPSQGLIQALMSLSDALLQLGVAGELAKRNQIIQATLRHLMQFWVSDKWVPNGEQGLHDLAFLHKLCDLQGPDCADIGKSIHLKIKANLPPDTEMKGYKRMASEYFSRTQTLFAIFVPCPGRAAAKSAESGDKLTGLLWCDAPSLDQQFHSALELAKPSPRFGLLLVGGSEGR